MALCAWVLAPHMGDLEETLGSWSNPGCWGHEGNNSGWLISLSSLYNSAFQINKFLYTKKFLLLNKKQ